MKYLAFRISFKIKLFRINLSQWFDLIALRAPLATLLGGLFVTGAFGIVMLAAAFKLMEPFFVVSR